MKNIKPIVTLFALFLSATVFGQIKPHLENLKSNRITPLTKEDMQLREVLPTIPKAENSGFQTESRQFYSLPALTKPIAGQPQLKIQAVDTGLPIVIKGKIKNLPEGNLEVQSIAYLEAIKEALQIKAPAEEFVVSKIETDDLGQTHIRMEQQLEGISIYGSEVILHQQEGELQLFNGRYYPTPELDDLTPSVSKNTALQSAIEDIELTETFKDLTTMEKSLLSEEQVISELVIFHKNKDFSKETLAWHFKLIPNVASHWSYFIDAQTGDVLQKFSHVCKLHHGLHKVNSCTEEHVFNNSLKAVVNVENLPPDGPAIATNETDLLGVGRNINTYEVGNTFFMLDGSRAMFSNAQSTLPNEPVGAIWTIDAQNTSPANNDFSATQISSSNNNWNNPSAVSAHYNGSKAYEYFLNTFGRNSINGQGGNIISVINTEDENGGDMDNAFWTGAAMFYGNGDQAFSSPLSKSLDVAGHEMSHGVVQTTANLEYMGESGALNESFADIFGTMIDRNDWQLGEDVVNTSIFSSGALRDMQFPNNGGSSLNDAGYQPDHVNNQFSGSADNGGVHINSGITNKAYFIFANTIGKDKAEQVYYRALTNYLVKSSQFVDLRIAVVQAATDLHGAGSTEVNAAKDALSAVGIGQGAGTNTQTNEQSNPGDEFILMTDDNQSQLYIFTPAGDAIANPLTSISPLSKPSVTDDGSTIVFVDMDKNIQSITIDWVSGSTSETVLSSNPIWRNAVISKDGTKLAALTDDLENKILVFDLANGGILQEFDLYNPTTGTGGPISDDVQYADIIEFDFTGEWIMYDAFNSLTNASGQDIEYWDIGFIRVFDNSSDSFDDGFVSKLFSGLPENTSVGNPTFSKNSDYIIALDFIDEFNNDYAILGVNTETGAVGTILDHSQLGYPNYSISDDQIVFDDVTGFFDDPRLSFVNLQSDKITGAGGVQGFIDNGKWGIWFANGERDLSPIQELVLNGELFNIYPNPVSDNLTIEIETATSCEVLIEVFDVVGKQVFFQKTNWTIGKNIEELELSTLINGSYFLKITKADGIASARISKF